MAKITTLDRVEHLISSWTDASGEVAPALKELGIRSISQIDWNPGAKNTPTALAIDFESSVAAISFEHIVSNRNSGDPFINRLRKDGTRVVSLVQQSAIGKYQCQCL